MAPFGPLYLRQRPSRRQSPWVVVAHTDEATWRPGRGCRRCRLEGMRRERPALEALLVGETSNDRRRRRRLESLPTVGGAGGMRGVFGGNKADRREPFRQRHPPSRRRRQAAAAQRIPIPPAITFIDTPSRATNY